MNKKMFTLITYTYIFIVVSLFALYLYRASGGQWQFELDGHRGNLSIFLGLIFIGIILASIDFAGIREKSNTVTKGMIFGGLTVAVFFLVWRAMMALV